MTSDSKRMHRQGLASCLVVFLILPALLHGFQLGSSRRGFVAMPNVCRTSCHTSRRSTSSTHWEETARKASIVSTPDAFLDFGEEDASLATLSTPEASTSTITSSIFNLVKATVGCGVLALPAGVAALSDSKLTIVPSSILLAVLGVVSAYTFGLYGRLVHATQAKSLGELWEKVQSKKSSWMVSAATMTFCYGAVLAYSIMLGDVMMSLSQSLGITSGPLASRLVLTFLLSSLVLLPLSSLQSLAALTPISMAGILSLVLTTIFVGWRCPTFNPASPYALGSGSAILSSLTQSQVPLFQTFHRGFRHPAALILASMSAQAFLGHFSAPDFYHGLLGSSSQDAKEVALGVKTPQEIEAKKETAINNFMKVVTGGFSGIIAVSCTIMALGFLTFGGNSDGIILNNYSALDPWAAFCRLIMAVNVVGGFPFLLRGCRNEALALMKDNRRTTENRVTRTLIASLAILSLLVRNAGFVIGFNGALMGSAIAYIFPALMFMKHLKGLGSLTRGQRLEQWLCRVLVGFGVFAGVAGGAVSILDTYFPALLL